MTMIDRRLMLQNLFGAALLATAGAGVMANVAEALPAASLQANPVEPDGLIEKAVVVVHRRHPVHRRHMHRRQVCFWRHGRRICHWR